jgi:hypothetical protein
MTHFDIKFEQIQVFMADGILMNFVARRHESKKKLNLDLIIIALGQAS